MNRYLHKAFSIDYCSLAALRVGLGLLVICDLIIRSRYLEAHYTDFGVLPLSVIFSKLNFQEYISVHYMNGHYPFQLFLFIIQFIFALCLLFGYKTKMASIVSWYLMISLNMRNPLILQGGDVLLRMLMFWGMFLPLNARYSLDLVFSSDKTIEQAYKEPRHFSFATIAILGQVFILYFFTAVLKMDSSWVTDGTALHYVMKLETFLTPIGLWFGRFHEHFWWMTKAVWTWEMFGCFLFFMPFFFLFFRSIAFVGFFGMHFSFVFLMEIGLFPYIDMVALLVFLPSAFWGMLNEKLSNWKFRKCSIYYDKNCKICKEIVNSICVFGGYSFEQLKYAQDTKKTLDLMESQNTWVVEDHAGKYFTRWDALQKITIASPLLWWLAFPVFFLSFVGQRIYSAFAVKRKQVAQNLSWLRNAGAVNIKPGFLTNIICGLCFVMVFLWNAQFISKDLKLTKKATYVGKMLRVDQKWNMFSPFPLKRDGWFRVEGKTIAGNSVDVFHMREGSPPLQKPTNIYKTYINQRWRKYLMNIYNKSYKDYRLYFGKWLCRRWNRGATGRNRLKNFKIDYHMRFTPKPGEPMPAYKKVNIWSHRCF